MPLATFLVEDSLTIRKNLIPAMEDMANAQVVGVAGSKREAVAWLKEHADEWQLAVVDVFLSEGSGLGVLRAGRGRRPDQLVVVLTNYATDEMRRRCLDVGADAVFDKSTELEAFLAYCLDAARHEVPLAPVRSPDDQSEARDLAQP
ncbi:response regulator [Variovorax sp. MHTC-1]|uniref:response regulator n=1 Tax=Variovorax sp. MHTC-1 TaxID=2495593 RepID=UPI000F870787|nr:response regulator [Variovorax sp. MHTC-1]RST49387.1 response regulator [Variovorax sp. MHTC-1]